jgi:hypothetical protein
MATSVKTFMRADYDKIKRDGFTFILPKETLEAIKKIALNVGAPEYIKTPHFEKRQNNNNKQRNNPSKEITDSEWDTLRNFKATTIEKKKGVELSIDKIRKHLNKLTDKTYDKLKDEIIDEIDFIVKEIKENEEFLFELNKIGDVIFEIASGNSFYSKMYATFYKMLMEKYIFMQTIFTTKIANDVYISKDFEYCDPNKDYDKFCLNNKKNEKRRALSLFYVNLMLQDIIPKTRIIDMIQELQSDILQFIRKPNNVNIVEEMTELIYILVINSAPVLKELEEDWEQIISNINYVSNIKTKSEPSISNKTIFKHMDMQTMLNK